MSTVQKDSMSGGKSTYLSNCSSFPPSKQFWNRFKQITKQVAREKRRRVALILPRCAVVWWSFTCTGRSCQSSERVVYNSRDEACGRSSKQSGVAHTCGHRKPGSVENNICWRGGNHCQESVAVGRKRGPAGYGHDTVRTAFYKHSLHRKRRIFTLTTALLL